jgi:hypothetical protein
MGHAADNPSDIGVHNMNLIQLTKAQLGAEVALDCGHTLIAIPVAGGWKYLVAWQGTVGLIRYAGQGLEAALWALNSSDEEYTA